MVHRTYAEIEVDPIIINHDNRVIKLSRKT